jgi:hypothetical protein
MDVPEITRHIFTRMKAPRTSVREKMDTLDRDGGMPADGTAFGWTVYGINQLTIDPTGVLRAIRRADEREILLTARLLQAIHDTFHEEAEALMNLTHDLMESPDWRQLSEAYAADARLAHPDTLGEMPPRYVERLFTLATVAGMFSWEYPEDLLQTFPTVPRLYTDVRGPEENHPQAIAMSMALTELLMLPSEDVWAQQQGMN